MEPSDKLIRIARWHRLLCVKNIPSRAEQGDGREIIQHFFSGRFGVFVPAAIVARLNYS
jgi:hypothetical protein